MSETVAIVKCSNYDQRAVDNALNELLDYLGGISQYVKPGNLVLIKPNLLKATCVGDIPSTHFTVIKSIVGINSGPPFRTIGSRRSNGNSYY